MQIEPPAVPPAIARDIEVERRRVKMPWPDAYLFLTFKMGVRL